VDNPETGMPLIFHMGGPRDGHLDEVAADAVTTTLLVYDGPKWFAVYERPQPFWTVGPARGLAEVWVVCE
jgi:hypothetical protein